MHVADNILQWNKLINHKSIYFWKSENGTWAFMLSIFLLTSKFSSFLFKKIWRQGFILKDTNMSTTKMNVLDILDSI